MSPVKSEAGGSKDLPEGGGAGHGAQGPPTRTRSRSRARAAGPKPGTRANSCTAWNGPWASLHPTIARALAGPTPGKPSRIVTSAVLRSTTPAGANPAGGPGWIGVIGTGVTTDATPE